jgi:hypothetical protein
LLNEWLKGLLVASKKFADVATLSRLGQEVHACKGALHDNCSLLLQEGVLNEYATPLRKQSKGIVELRLTSLRTLQLGEQLTLNVLL